MRSLRAIWLAAAFSLAASHAAAQGEVSHIEITADAGAEIYIDGQPMGQAPLANAVAVKPGSHVVEARLNGRVAKVTVNAPAGAQAAAALAFSAEEPAPAPVPAAAPAAAGEPAAAPPAEPAEPPPDSATASAELDSGGGREPFIGWATRNKLAWVGGGVTLLGVAGGVTFSLIASSNYSVANERGDLIRERKEDEGYSGPVCEAPPTDAYEMACGKFADARDQADTQKTIGIISFIVAGVAAGGTVAYYFVDAKKEAPTARDKTPRTALVPMASPDGAGLSVVGLF